MTAIEMNGQLWSTCCHDRQRQTSNVGTSSDGRLFVCTCTADVADTLRYTLYSANATIVFISNSLTGRTLSYIGHIFSQARAHSHEQNTAYELGKK